MTGRNGARKMTGIVSVPATPDDVRRFLDGNRRKYEQDLQRLQLVLSGLRRKERALRHVYKIYSRGEAQAGDELKSARKIRLKFNDFNEKRKSAQASLFDVPDIVGLRIVVSYPSDISAIAAVLDNAIDRKELLAVAMGAPAPSSVITTRYGRPLETGGYFACHYNVRLPGVGIARPICEIQIKTLLHDAWGAKTHDLTYKPAGRIGAELLTSFDLLGASLANLDQQSDALKTSIVRNASVREAKRRRVQTCVLHDLSAGVLDSVADAELRLELVGLHSCIAPTRQTRTPNRWRTAFFKCLSGRRSPHRACYASSQPCFSGQPTSSMLRNRFRHASNCAPIRWTAWE